MNAQGKVHKYGDNVDTDVIIPAEEVVPENFNSAEALMELITRLDEE